MFRDENALTSALGEVEDTEDAHAAAVAAKEENEVEGADAADFAWELTGPRDQQHNNDATVIGECEKPEDDGGPVAGVNAEEGGDGDGEEEEEEEDEGGTTEDYMLAFIQADMEFFNEWRLPGFKE